MNDYENQETTQSLSQKRGVSWASGLFTVLGLAFFGLSLYIVIVRQNGRFDLPDTVMMSITVLMFLASLASLILARKNWVALSAGIIFGVSLVPPIIATLMIKDFALISIAYIAAIVPILIFLFLPKTFRRWAFAIVLVAVIIIISVEVWDPPFRDSTSVVQNFVSVIVPLAVLGLLAFAARWAWSGNLRSQLITSILMVAIVPLAITVGVLSYRSFSIQTSQSLEAQDQIAKRVAEQVKSFALAREGELNSLVEVDELGTLNLEGQTKLLNNLLLAQSLYDELVLVNKNGREIIRASRLNVIASDQLVSRSGKDEFERPKATGKTYFGPVLFYAVDGQPYQVISIPIYNLRSGQLNYVLIANLRFKTIWDLMAQADVIGSGNVYLIDDQNRVVAHANPSIALQQKKVSLPAKNSFTQGLNGEQVAMARKNITLNEQSFTVIAEQPSSEALALPTNNFVISVVLTLGMTLLAGFVGVRIANFITKPIGELSEAAQAIIQGDYSQQVVIERQNEIGILANAFNSMTAQLSGLIVSLEQRVADRTRNLELAAEVGRTVSQVRALDVMLTDAAELIRRQFDLYYVQVYLTDSSETYLNLQAGTGEVGKELLGRKHRLPLNTDSINGRAVIEKKSVVISDISTSATFKPNPLLPNTHSEMAVPLMIGNKVVGVLDMQSEQAGSLSTDILSAFEALAGQLAIAIQNANFLAETNQARAEVEAQARRMTRSSWEEYLDAVHQPEHIGFMFANDQITTLTDVQQSEQLADKNSLTAPIAMVGEKFGALVVDMDEANQNAQTIELVNTVARQVSQQIENLRLLDSAERYRAEAEQASRRQTLEGWKDYTDANISKGLSYIYDLKEVRPHNPDKDMQVDTSTLNLPLKVREETIGKLVVQGIEKDDSESRELVNAVAERLGAHIENLRLSSQTQDRARREQALRQITSAVRGSTDPDVILRSAARELGTLLGRKTIVRLNTETRQANQSNRPADLAEETIANNGNKPIPPAESKNAVGGDE